MQRFLKTLLATGAFAVAAAATAADAATTEEAAAQMVQRMETHWQRLIHENEPERRRVLAAEHRKLMAEAGTALGQAAGTAPGMGHGTGRGMTAGSHHRDLRNTLELHSLMLELMQP